MKIYTKDRDDSLFCDEWELVIGEEWDKLNEGQRGFVSYNGEWRMAKKTKSDVSVIELRKTL
ncbi:MAG: hypothetical protein PHW73_05980 [Atribacterota bacterium]|nr:hypothetical protein [Atribacterota bacterium]